jgi:hypothetical protein
MGSSKNQRVFNQNFASLIKNCAFIDHSDIKKQKKLLQKVIKTKTQ